MVTMVTEVPMVITYCIYSYYGGCSYYNYSYIDYGIR